MAVEAKQPTYNERLFSGGLRARLHMARFLWVRRTFKRLNITPQRVLELGCYDGRVLDFLPARPVYYLGLDADWEGGLLLANRRWGGQADIQFRKCREASEMALDGAVFDTGLSLETLEHIPPEHLNPYLKSLASSISNVFLVTIPNETGIVFAAKHVLKMLFIGKAEQYSFREFIWQTLGHTERVARREHKGFSYAKMIKTLSVYFDIERVEGIPFSFLPPALNFGAGVICRPKLRPR